MDFGFSPTTAPCRQVRERLIDELDPLHRNEIHDCTDSEHVFRYLTTLWEREPERPLLEVLRVSLERVIDWCREIDPNRRISLNVRWTDTSGQKIGYVTDAADTPVNRQVIIDLVRGADLLFIEAAFAEADTGIAAERAHLTTRGADEIARAAEARRVEPFHFRRVTKARRREW